MDPVSEAKALMNNPAFVAALEGVRKYHIDQAMKASPANDLARRHHLGLAKDLDGIAHHLGALVASEKPDDVHPEDFYVRQATERRKLFGLV